MVYHGFEPIDGATNFAAQVSSWDWDNTTLHFNSLNNTLTETTFDLTNDIKGKINAFKVMKTDSDAGAGNDGQYILLQDTSSIEVTSGSSRHLGFLLSLKERPTDYATLVITTASIGGQTAFGLSMLFDKMVVAGFQGKIGAPNSKTYFGFVQFDCGNCNIIKVSVIDMPEGLAIDNLYIGDPWDGGLSTGAIIGIVLGSVALAAIIVLGAYLFFKSRQTTPV